jgi:glycine/D-amino acid oxidase-like deaminating enzyme
MTRQDETMGHAEHDVGERIRFTRDVPIVQQADVVVMGGGPTGIAAALASAQEGADTLLVERYGFLGGNATAGLVGPLLGAFDAAGEEQLICGLFETFVQRMIAADGAIHPREIRTGDPHVAFSTARIFDHATPFDPETMKVVAARLLRESGVDLLLHSFFVDAMVEDRTLKGVIVANKSGLQAIAAKVVVDCTGDGDVAARAGAPVAQGRAEDGLVQPSTMFFRIKDVDKPRYHAYVRETQDRHFHILFARARAAGDITFQREIAVVLEQPRGDEWRVNCTRIHGVDGTNVRDLTRAEIEGREQVQELIRFFRKYVPGFERCTLVDTGAQVGVRETRRIVGEYTLTADDILCGTPFDDVVVFCAYPPDLHSPTNSGHTNVGQMTANAYQIPYRAMVPQVIDGLLAAGRCISATHEALSAVRVMAQCFGMGQAAGTAAALAVGAGVLPRQVDVRTLQRTLVMRGVNLCGVAGNSHPPVMLRAGSPLGAHA